MKTLILLLIYFFVKLYLLMDKKLPYTLGELPAFWYEDSLFIIFFAIGEVLASKKTVKTLYFVALCYLALNVPVWRVLSTPFTPAIFFATGGPLKDSILSYLTVKNLIPGSLIIAFGIGLPRIFKDHRAWVYLSASFAILVAILGSFRVKKIDTLGLDRNPFLLLAYSFVERVGFDSRLNTKTPRDVNPLVTYPNEALAGFRGKFLNRSILHVILESTGAQYLKPYGATEDPMPYLTKLASRGIVFENAYSVYPESIKGLFSVLCSTFPAFDSKAEEYSGVGPPSIAEVVRQRGYSTALFHSGRFDYLGMNAIVQKRGFDHLVDASSMGDSHSSSFGMSDERVVVRKMLQWVDSLKGEGPFYLLYLPIAGHHPYLSPEKGPFSGEKFIHYYYNSIHHMDDALKLLVEELKKRTFGQDPVVIIHADHGEAFHQHPGNSAHSLFIYDENILVPFIIVPPDQETAIRMSPSVSLIDVSPTLLDLVGIPSPSTYQGVSLLRSYRSLNFFLTDYSLGFLGLREGQWKYIYEVNKRRSSLFDLSMDPNETTDRAKEFSQKVATYEGIVLDWASQHKKKLFHFQ